ncbi:hypothetical protein WJX74_008792 [Apatococcus lobatus]|uniref:Cytochrome P450 n=1 Tax=Apatococcus lobatus TaxID=904363 RepID=A0AAW1QY00_9CHLO
MILLAADASLAAELGGIYRIRLGLIQAVIVTDPYIISEILAPGAEVEKSIDLVYSHFDVLNHASGKPTIFTSPSDDHWRLVRKAVAPAFNPKNIRHGFQFVQQTVSQLIDILKLRGPDEVIDMDNAALRVTLDVIGQVGFGKDFGATKSLDARDTANAAFATMEAGRDEGVKRWNNPLRRFCTFLPDVRKGKTDFARFRAVMTSLLSEIKARGETQSDDVSIAAHLLRMRDAKGQPLPDDRLAAEIGVFFTGGFETTGHTIGWALYMISQHPEVEAKVVAELDDMGLLATCDRPDPRPMEHADLQELKYTLQAIKESMRLLPVLTGGTNRTTAKPTRIGPVTVPAGTMVWIPFSALFNSPHNWEAPDVYDPDRWRAPDVEYAVAKGTNANGHVMSSLSTDLGKTSHVLHLEARAGGVAGGAVKASAPDQGRTKRWMPFSMGSRDCIGQNLARMNYMTAVAMLLSHFHFELAPEMGGKAGVRAAESAALLTLQPRHGMKMLCMPRQSIRSAHR